MCEIKEIPHCLQFTTAEPNVLARVYYLPCADVTSLVIILPVIASIITTIAARPCLHELLRIRILYPYLLYSLSYLTTPLKGRYVGESLYSRLQSHLAFIETSITGCM